MKNTYPFDPSQNKVVIIAGGKGTRLGELTKTIPKPLVPLDGKPLLWYVLTYARQYGFSSILLKTGYLAEQIQAYLTDGHQFHAMIDYFIEKEPLGTAGGLHFLTKENAPVLILYGDVLSTVNLRRLYEFHQQTKAQATLVVHSSDHPEDSDVVLLDDTNRVKKIIHKPGNARYGTMTNAALYLLNPECFSLIPQQGTFDFARDLIPELLHKKMVVYGYRTDEYIRDIGTTQRLKQASQDLAEGKILNRVSSVFLDRDGTINAYVEDLHRIEEVKVLSGAARAIRRLNDAHIPVIVATNQPSIAKGFCDVKTIDAIHELLQKLLRKAGAYVDAIEYCPHHPEKGHKGERPEYKIACTCRKPAIGMLQKAQKRYNLDLSRSFFVGDSPRDVLTGKNAGCRTILLRSGCPLPLGDLGGPDYIMKDLAEAVQFICTYNRSTFAKVMSEIKEKLFVQKRVLVLIDGWTKIGPVLLSKQLAKSLSNEHISSKTFALEQLLDRNLINLTTFSSEKRGKKASQLAPNTRLVIIEGVEVLTHKLLVNDVVIRIFNDEAKTAVETKIPYTKSTWKKADYIL
ncbi:HAD-IIIA family hydrolase [Candidatus Woesearchaeota archaeon]|nr:HAD-IIIA family hydrolase [Candidatus Woesearchaeota archaeon]